MAQNLIVALLVGSCLVYVMWTLAPKAPRSRLARALLKLPMPRLLHKPLLAATRQQGGCGSCGGCAGPVGAKGEGAVGTVPAAKPAAECLKPLTFLRGNYAGKTPL